MSDKPRDLLVLIQDLEFGGTQRYVCNLLKHLDRTLFTPRLWVLRGGDGMLPMAQEAGVEIERLSESPRWVTPYAIFRLLWKLKRERPEIIYTLGGIPNGWGRVFAKMLQVPVIVSGYRSLMPVPYEKWFWKLSDKIICNANAPRDVLIRTVGVAPDLVTVVPNGVDTEFFQPCANLEAAEPTVVYIGRLVNEKDPLTLVEAFRQTLDRVPSAHFKLIGDGYLKPKVVEFLSTHRLEDRISLIPGTDRVKDHLSEAWVLAIASQRESSANVVIEAMAMGLPVVGTRVGGIPDMVKDGETGILVEPADPSEFSRALTGLLLNENARRTVGAKGRERVLAHHSLQRMARNTEEAFLSAWNEARVNRNPEQ